MSNHINRRGLLGVAAAATGAMTISSLPSPVEATTETPVAALFREWEAALAAEEIAFKSCEDEAERNLVWQPRDEIEARMLATPSQRPSDFILKVMAFTFYGEGGLPDRSDMPTLWDEAHALSGVPA